MILKVLKSNRSINLLIFPIIGLIFWLKSLLNPFSEQFFLNESNNILFAPILRITRESDFIRVLLSLVFVIFIGAIVQVLNHQYSFIRERTKLPGTLFVIIIGGFIKLHTFHPVLPAAIFLLFAIYSLFGVYEKKNPYSNIFNAGFLVGVGTLFYLNLLVFLPVFFIGIVILSKKRSWRSFVILLIGFFVPILFAFSYAGLTEQTIEMLIISKESIVNPSNQFSFNIPIYIYLSFLILLTLAGSIKIIVQFDSKKVSTRKYYTLFFVMFILSIINFALFPGSSMEMLIITAIPVTYLISNLFVFMKSRFWGEFFFLLLIGIIIFMQFLDNIF